MTLIEKLNTGILEAKGIWNEYYTPTENAIFNAYFYVAFCKEYKAPNGFKVYHSDIAGEESISIFKGSIRLKTIKDKEAVKKQVLSLSKIEFIGNVPMSELI